jgi:hypothetical protein
MAESKEIPDIFNTSAPEPEADNYVEELATRLVVGFQKQLDPQLAAMDTSKEVYDETYEDKIPYYIDAIEMLLQNPATDKYAALSWNAFMTASTNNQDLDVYFQRMLDYLLSGYYKGEKPDVEMKDKRFSGHSAIMARTFIKMTEVNAANSDICAEIYKHLVRKEMDLDSKAQAIEKEHGESPLPSMQKMYDDVIDYLATRADFRASSLNEENPYEYVGPLAEKLRGTRRYVMQDVMNQRALEKKKMLEMELENRLASAEEIVIATNPFAEGLLYFVKEKKYNYKFLAVEKVRLTLQVIGSIIGAFYFLAGYMSLWEIEWYDGVVVCMTMILFTRMIGSRTRFAPFYPVDVSKELEQNATQFINVMRHMSQDQMEHFVARQIMMERNQNFLTLVPDFIKYLYAIMPDRKNMVITVDELSELVENAEIEVAKQLRAI